MKQIILFLIGLAVVGGGAFYGGMQYGQSKGPVGFSQGNFANLSNLSAEERQERFGQMGAAGLGFTGDRTAVRTGSGLISGEVMDKDEQTLTIKLRDGGSSIVFFSGSTKISKMADGSADDLEIGKQVMVSGEQNTDGSYTAETIQLSQLTPVLGQ